MSNESKIAGGTAQRTSKRTHTYEFRIGCPLNVYAEFSAEAAAINFQICRSPAQSGNADVAAEFEYLCPLPRSGCLDTYNFKPAHVIFLVWRKLFRTPSLYWGELQGTVHDYGSYHHGFFMFVAVFIQLIFKAAP